MEEGNPTRFSALIWKFDENGDLSSMSFNAAAAGYKASGGRSSADIPFEDKENDMRDTLLKTYNSMDHEAYPQEKVKGEVISLDPTDGENP